MLTYKLYYIDALHFYFEGNNKPWAKSNNLDDLIPLAKELREAVDTTKAKDPNFWAHIWIDVEDGVEQITF